eukprot:m.227433 g.227433  ORF g.227433 m.227433 type:complete len:213 (+) comp11585_c0_seq1:629-1267(+)
MGQRCSHPYAPLYRGNCSFCVLLSLAADLYKVFVFYYREREPAGPSFAVFVSTLVELSQSGDFTCEDVRRLCRSWHVGHSRLEWALTPLPGCLPGTMLFASNSLVEQFGNTNRLCIKEGPALLLRTISCALDCARIVPDEEHPLATAFTAVDVRTIAAFLEANYGQDRDLLSENAEDALSDLFALRAPPPPPAPVPFPPLVELALEWPAPRT